MTASIPITTLGIFIYELFYASSIGNSRPMDPVVEYGTNDPIGTIISGGIVTYPGQYTSFDGHIDSSKVLQDDYYYQDFSYVVKSSVPLLNYEQLVSQLLHPAGTKLFGQFHDDIGLELPTISIQNSSLSLGISDIYALPIVAYVSPAILTTGTISLPPIYIIDNEPLPILTYLSNFRKMEQMADQIQVSSSGTLSNYASFTGNSLRDWSGNTFTNGTGVLGVGSTTFLSYLSATLPVEIIDLSSVNPVETNVIYAVDSNTTARLVFPYSGSLTNGNFIA